ncbi:hypothetical protein VF04_03930 [Nostoc linckia z7]|uniref:Uncharacterized protein n=4 Tax=Nostoc linckia TaxID=92942 RepID=A0A9Q5ZGF4_NOSLI|nr:hypothetical protein VF02_11420 [Nostoc linckia z1]PHJ70123.1 hypothetical protein VF05_11575 [Nostoc linckia z3]PHJ75024.1 hypothetical protein VF03_11735 [Nostoc linckia z2]PHJ83049.1 hypothetical protein VF06_15000 [Nostoc linckia z4]PHJ89146.1 hypothetical protein VF07_14195 [Nostoc linckia z6]PHK00068.1 hypothetical protein VF04_03930 [Nostoc linckia z7]PHK06731.1 hypothetical protein VF08_03060 [Nostoc linckia z8]PHK23131.1 hypothetical protein VF11_02110 [Nostoc linckia z14]PHK268
MEWLHKLKHWILNFIYPKKKYYKVPKLMRRWDGAHCAVLRIQRNTKGGMSTYRITSRYGGCDYLITLDDLSELKAELLGEFNGITIKILGDSSPLTHRFSVWRIFINGSSSAIGIWDVDLQGITSNLNLRHLAPVRAVAGVALKPLSLIHSKKNSELSWHNQMERIDWIALLERRIRGELNNPSHNIKATIVYQQDNV